MGLCNLRSLLLAAIFLSYCVTWTASRHHHTHNVHGHRSRHRRQGAGLFLPSSYVIPGGEGTGAWGEWADETPCSRTCGVGVASQKRICLEVGPDGRPLCRGGDTKYFSCGTQDCPDGTKDFRAQQCSEYDNVSIKGIKYKWVPYTKGPNQCELNCMPRGERFYYRQKNKVIDGTRCNDESFDVCVNGICQPVGCDMMLGSPAREDKCRQCRGNGTNCHTVGGVLDTLDLRNGYNDMLLIPQGATTISFTEIKPSSNYLALRAKNNTYYLNGDYHIDFPRSIVIAGATWYYERNQNGLPSPDKLRCQGPTDEPLFLSLLVQEPNVGIEYEYSIPTALAPPANAQYNWVYDEFSPCNATCGGGVQTRNVTCRSREELEVVEAELCEAQVKPISSQTCNTNACPPRWVEGEWSPCSKRCGEGGTRSRQVHCEKIITNGFPSVVGDDECFELLGKKPSLFEKCNENATCPIWFTGPWKPCDKLCGEGKQTRQLVCYQKNGAKVEVLSDDMCTEAKPPAEQTCIQHPCDGVDWVLSDWTGCDNCLSRVRSRTALCSTKDEKVMDPELCSYHPKPVLEEPCDRTKLPACEVQWYATQWSKCSAECGTGEQTRRVFCGLFDGASVLKVDDNRCDKATRYNDTKPCEVPKDKCPSKWFAGPWSECTVKCGGGEQYRRVMCLRGDVPAKDCDVDSVLDSTQSCNHGPCNEDDILPMNPNSTPIMDDEDYDECEEEEEYPEVGAEADPSLSLATDDMMFSDSPYTELESEFTTDTGSGFDTLSTEGSGLGTTDSSSSTEEEWTTSETGSTSETFDSSTETEETTETGTIDTGSTDASSTSEATEATDKASKSSDSTETTDESSAEVSESSVSTEESSTSSSDMSTTSELKETGSTESSATELDKSTEMGSTDKTSASVNTETTEKSSSSDETTISDVTKTSDSTEISESTEYKDETSSESDYTEYSSSESSEYTEETTSDKTETTDETTEKESTEPSGSTEKDTSDVTEESTSSSPTESASESSSIAGSTDDSSEVTTESSAITEESGSTASESTEETTELGTTESSTDEGGSTTESGASTEFVTTESDISTESDLTTDAGSTASSVDVTETISTDETGSTEFTTEKSDATTEGNTEETVSTEEITTESANTDITSEATEETGSTVTEESLSESTTEESTEETGSTTESSYEESSTTEGIEESTLTGETTPWDWATTIEGASKKPKCKPRVSKCAKSTFGCCPDKKTAAAGPFDEGCASPKTCKETKFGCCPDGVSPALGPKDKGCPIPPCNETLFGCCSSDNSTAAEGNDQEGCPPIPPACKASKYGCCKDGETEATGPAKKGCPETVQKEKEEKEKEKEKEKEGCEKSKFGCCHDNVTEAAGPSGQGCPCNATEFGCCPDGVTTAGGAQMEGCMMSCNSSDYGCCPDGQTPAHGPDHEGCCLLYAYGCCPDNYKPAEGPNHEGCGCQFSRYGCCPDNVTIARGPDNHGCGCQYTQHGCCPDRHTEATGPKFEGCSCDTYQFGCCDDGVNIARGPGQAGCSCQKSEFGCCGDEKTPASGPDQAGCTCANSKYGCCPDGHTAANGTKFSGCTDKPENRQAACALSTDRGPCTNYSVLWYYDMEYGGCSRFWYGGCDGNGNRFTSKEECEDVCVQPAPKDACSLPRVKGACVGYHPRWYYDTEREQCGQFIFGGCLGNANNFDSRELCQTQCEPARSKDKCSLPIERGECNGDYFRWGFNSETRKCEQFSWGGCGDNSNRFLSETACLHHCNPPGAPQPVCKEPLEAGNCTEKQPAWAFNQTENRCVPFYYTGCGGNGNRFDQEASCSEVCPSTYVKDICTLPALTGECADYSEKWYYDTSIKICRQFYYGGCGGNENRFSTQQECENRCFEREVTTAAPHLETTTVGDLCYLPSMTGGCDNYTEMWFYEAKSRRCQQFYYGGCGGNANRFANREACEGRCGTPVTTTKRPPNYEQEICFLGVDSGPCSGTQARWAYDSERGLCVPFNYGGCGGNMNNFPDEEYCQHACGNIQDVCQLPMMQGPCDDSVMQWFYDPASDTCSQFTYGGCEGNANRFGSMEDCERRCRTGPAPANTTAALNATTTSAPRREDLPACRITPEPNEECDQEMVVWYFDRESNSCASYKNAASGRVCRRTGVFETEETCERACGAFRNINVCRYGVDPGPCRAAIPKFYYDEARDTCLEFGYGGCHGGPNRFSTVQECEDVCKYEKDPCRRTPKPINCLDYDETWYFDESRDECYPYASCDHSDTSRFLSREQCESQCRARPPVLTTTVRPRPPPEPVNEECRTPSSLSPCGTDTSVFYYDAERRACLEAGIGGCGLANSYRSEEECQRRCGAFRGLDACRSPLDVGLCNESVVKYYWKSSSGRCEPYAYSGCGGGPNRFSTADECQRMCSHLGPDAACLEPVSVGEPCGVPAQRRWYYEEREARCLPFVYEGCGDHGNNFRSPEECAARCLVGPPDESEGNEVLPDCDRFNEECARIRCEYGVQRTRTVDGCERCSCVQVETDCGPLRAECEALKCAYGVGRSTGPDGCERCTCTEHPCAKQLCLANERCVASPYRDPITQEVAYTADCHEVNKTGVCPADESTEPAGHCRRECNDDADCRGVGKCCSRGCSQLCLVPRAGEATAPATAPPPTTSTYSPELPQAPQANPLTEPNVAVPEGGKATLRCLFHGNPPPKITWRRGEITIDGDVGRYRLLSDGALEIVSLYRNDSGVYLCVAENIHGVSRQEIRLQVNDPVEAPVGISGEANAVVTGELGRSLNLRCLAFGYPQPSIYWYRGRVMLPYSSELYEARGNVLQIRRLDVDTLGEYACQAYNGVGKAALWAVQVRAYRPDTDPQGGNELLVERTPAAPAPPSPAATAPTTPPPEVDMPVYTVPVNTSISGGSQTLAAGGQLSVRCNVDGFPLPEVIWTKDDGVLTPSDRLQLTESRLTLTGLTVADSGVYGCHARNIYSSHSSTVSVTVQDVTVPVFCTDSPFFADCQLIVRSKYCHHQYYSKFCCKSCVEAGQLNPLELSPQSDAPWKKK